MSAPLNIVLLTIMKLGDIVVCRESHPEVAGWMPEINNRVGKKMEVTGFRTDGNVKYVECDYNCAFFFKEEWLEVVPWPTKTSTRDELIEPGCVVTYKDKFYIVSRVTVSLNGVDTLDDVNIADVEFYFKKSKK